MTTCSCGVDYAPTTDGRQRHRLIEGHTPSPAPEPAPQPIAITSECKRGLHYQCGHGADGGVECACTCGHEGA